MELCTVCEWGLTNHYNFWYHPSGHYPAQLLDKLVFDLESHGQCKRSVVTVSLYTQYQKASLCGTR